MPAAAAARTGARAGEPVATKLSPGGPEGGMRSSRARVRMVFSMSGLGAGVDRRSPSRPGSARLPEDRDLDAVGAQFAVEDVDRELEALVGLSGGAYQSVMITPPNGSADTSGMKSMVSSAARHR